VPWFAGPDSEGIYFYSEEMENLYTQQNVYFLHGESFRSHDPRFKGKVAAFGKRAARFPEILHLETDRYPLTALFDDPESDYWLWDYIVAGDPGKTYSAELPVDADEPAMLTIHLLGATNTTAQPDHHVTVSINGYPAGEPSGKARFLSTWSLPSPPESSPGCQ